MIRIGIRMLTGNFAKFLGIVGGVTFTSFLILHFCSIFVAIMSRTYAQISDVPEADVWVMDPAVEYVEEVAALPAPALNRVKGVDGVAWCSRLYLGSVRARLEGGRFRTVNVVGVDEATLIGVPRTMLNGTMSDLRKPDAVIIDDLYARTLLRPSAQAGWGVGTPPTSQDSPTRPLRVGDTLLLNDRAAVVAGIVRISPRFLSRATLFTTYERAIQFAPPERNLLSFVLVKAAAGTSPAELARRIEAQTGLRARTQREFQRDTTLYYVRNTDILGQIGIMSLIAITIGVSITGLLLFMFTTDNQRLYATLLALGLRPRTLLLMIVCQALVAGAAGLGVGAGVSACVGHLMHSLNLPFRMPGWGLLASGAGVLFVCACAAAISARAVLKLEPAQVFRA